MGREIIHLLGQSVSQSVRQSISQSVSQLVIHSVSQWVDCKHLFWWLITLIRVFRERTDHCEQNGWQNDELIFYVWTD